MIPRTSKSCSGDGPNFRSTTQNHQQVTQQRNHYLDVPADTQLRNNNFNPTTKLAPHRVMFKVHPALSLTSFVADSETQIEPAKMTATHEAEEPASFKTLPREIRQKILLESFQDATAKDLEFNKLANLLCVSMATQYMGKLEYAPHIMEWASTLRSTDTNLVSDIPYVVNQALISAELEFSKTRKQFIDAEPSTKERCVQDRWGRLMREDPRARVLYSFQFRTYSPGIWGLSREPLKQHQRNIQLIKATFWAGDGNQLYPDLAILIHQ